MLAGNIEAIALCLREPVDVDNDDAVSWAPLLVSQSKKVANLTIYTRPLCGRNVLLMKVEVARDKTITSTLSPFVRHAVDDVVIAALVILCHELVSSGQCKVRHHTHGALTSLQ